MSEPALPVTEHGVKYLVDVLEGHKTGFYIDQRDNRRLAASLVADGAAVTICGRTPEKLEAAAAALGAVPDGGPVAWVAADVTSEPDVEAAVAHAVAHGGGRLTAAVNSAGHSSIGAWPHSSSQRSRASGRRLQNSSATRGGVTMS